MINRNWLSTRIFGLALVGALMPGLASAEEPIITGSIRAREEIQLNYDRDSDRGDQDNFALGRTRIMLSAPAGDNLNAVVEFQDSRAYGEPSSSTTSLEQVDMHEAYIDIKEAFGQPLRFRIGRQEMRYGGQRLVGAEPFSNVGRAFDGVRMRYDIEDFGWFDAFAHKTLETGGIGPGVNDGANAPGDEEQAFLGVYLHYDLNENTSIESYVLDLYSDLGDAIAMAKAADGFEDRRANRFTAGGRVESSMPDTGLRFYAEGAYQFGSGPDPVDGTNMITGDAPDIAAWAATAGARLDFETSLPFWIAGEWNMASGDDPSTPEDERFSQLFATEHAVLGAIDFIRWENISAFMGSLGVQPNEDLQIWGSFHSFGLQQAPDGFDSAIGSEIDLTARVRARETLSLEFNYSMWMPGSYEEQTLGGGTDIDPVSLDAVHFVYLQSTLEF